MILIGEPSLRRAVDQFCEHYQRERNHQGLENKILEPEFASSKEMEVRVLPAAWWFASLLPPGCRVTHEPPVSGHYAVKAESSLIDDRPPIPQEINIATNPPSELVIGPSATAILQP
jgi:hypothetical protein